MPPRKRGSTEKPASSDTAAQRQRTAGTARSKAAAAATAARVDSARTATQQMFAGDPCAIVTGRLEPFTVERPSELTSIPRVTAAGQLLLAHHFGTRLRFLAAIDRAREFLDDDKICLDDALPLSGGNDRQSLLNLLNCWPRFKEMLPSGELTRLTARVLGVGNADVPPEDRNTTIQPQLGALIDALNDVCNPGCFQNDPTTSEVQRLGVAARRVRANFSASVSSGMALRIAQFDFNLAVAQLILKELTGFIPTPPCSLGPNPGEFGTLLALVGDDLKADGIDVTEALEIGQAWTDIFAWLVDPGFPDPDAAQCEAAAILRPSYRRAYSKQCSD